MIVIKEIKVVNVDRNIAEFAIADHKPFVWLEKPGLIPESIEVTREMVRGRIFVNTRGQRLCIGMTREVQEAIGLPFEIFDSMDQKITGLSKQNHELRCRAQAYMDWHDNFIRLNFWGRLKYAFLNLRMREKTYQDGHGKDFKI